MWYCYLLHCVKKDKTYVGATIDPDRRLKQHNGLLSGGAKATKGHEWERRCLVGTFPDETSALQFEWKWKNLSKKQKGSPLQRRFAALDFLMKSEKSTKNSIPFDQYEALNVSFE